MDLRDTDIVNGVEKALGLSFEKMRQFDDDARNTVFAILKATSEMLKVVELAHSEHCRLNLCSEKLHDVLCCIRGGASATGALDCLKEQLASQAAQDTANLHASKLSRILIDPKMEVLFLGAAAMLPGKDIVRTMSVSRGFRSQMQGAVTSLEGFPRATTDDTIKAVACQFSRLDSIDLTLCEEITDEGVVALAKGCPGLTNIILRCCRNVTDVGLAALAKGCPGLTNIELSGCSNVTDVGLDTLAGGIYR